MGRRAVQITVSERQRAILEGWTRKKAATPYRLVQRSQIILLSADGMANVEQGRRFGVDIQLIKRWRSRWAAAKAQLKAAEDQGASDRDLADLIHDLLSDEYRSGTPSTFSAEQLTQIIAVACEQPQDCGRPVTHWTPRELVDEVIGRGIVESISPRHIDRVLKGGISVHTRPSIG